MKLFYLLIFVCISFLSFSQGNRTEKTKVTKSQFSKAKTIQEFLPSFPKDCSISEYQFAIDTHEAKRNIKIKNNEISSDLKLIVKEMKAGQKIFIENIKSDCKTEFKKNYVLILI